MSYRLLLVHEDGAVSAVLLRLSVSELPPGGRDIDVIFKKNLNNSVQTDLDRADVLAESAEIGARLAYRILFREGIVRAQLAVECTVDGRHDNVVGRSTDLAFALAVILRVFEEISIAGSRASAFPPIAATGVLDPDGSIQPVEYAPAKVEAALASYASTPAAVFFPAGNASEVDGEDLSARYPHAKVMPIANLSEALEHLGITLEHTYLTNPFRGLEYFDYEHRAIFFGRGADREAVIERLFERERRGRPGILIIGASGSGKSSFVRASLLPALCEPTLRRHPELLARPFSRGVRHATWRPSDAGRSCDEAAMARSIAICWGKLSELASLATYTPLKTLEELAEKLSHDWPQDKRFVWMIDQLEEMFGLEIAASLIEDFAIFLNRLQGKGCWVVATLRDDCLTTLLRSELLRNLFGSSDGTYYLPSLNHSALEEAILGPACAADLLYERLPNGDRLDRVLLADSFSERAPLPLLEFTLAELYRQRVGSMLTFEAYRACGGLRGAVAGRSQGLVEKLTSSQRDTLLGALGRMICVQSDLPPDNPGSYSRVVAQWEDFSREEQQALQILVESRLLVTSRRFDGDVTVEFAHEALIENWPPLTGWLRTHRAAILWKQEFLAPWLRAWRAQRKSSRLLPRRLLRQARSLKVAATHLSEAETAYLHASYRYRVAILIAALISGGFIVSILAAFAYTGLQHALLTSHLTDKAWEATIEDKETTGIRYALAAAQLAHRDASLQPLLARLAFALPIDDGWNIHSVKDVDLASFSTDGSQLLTVSVDRRAGTSIARIWELASGRLLRQLAIKGAVESASLSPDGRLLLTTIRDDYARLFELEGQRELMHFGPSITQALFFPNGEQVLTVSEEGEAQIWDIATGNKRLHLWHDETPIREAILSPDGTHVLTISNDGAASLYKVSKVKGERPPTYLHDLIDYGSFSRDGTRVVTESDIFATRVWDVATGLPVNHFKSDTHAELTSDGQRILTSSNKTVSIKEVASGSVITEVACDYTVISANLSPDGKRVLVEYGNGTNDHQSFAVWELADGPKLRPLVSDDGVRFDIQFSPDGRQTLTHSMDRVVRIWGTRGSRLLAQLPTGGSTQQARFSADSRELLTVASDAPDGLQPATVRLWNVGSRAMVSELAQKNRVLDVNVLSERMQIITASPDDKLHLYDGFPGPVTAETSAPGVYFAEILGNGNYVRTVGAVEDKNWDRIWDTAQNNWKQAIYPITGQHFYSRDGTRVGSWHDRIFEISDLQHGGVTELHTDQPADDAVHVKFFSDDRVLTSSGGIMQMWNGKSGREVWLADARGTVFDTEVSDDERRIITVTDRTLADEAIVGIFDSANGRELNEISSAQMPSVIALSHDGSKVLLAQKDDADFRIYDSMTGRELARLAASATVTTAAFSSDGLRLVVGSKDGMAAIWDISVLFEPPTQLIERLCRFPAVIPPTFSDAELWGDSDLRSSKSAQMALAQSCANAEQVDAQ